MVAAPLLVLADPTTAMLWALTPPMRRGVGLWWRRRRVLRATWRLISSAGAAWVLHVMALWIWHLPSLYDGAVADGAVHVLEHLTFLATALLFWWIPFRAHGRRLGAGASLLYLFAAVLQGTLLGALLALARHPLYAAHFGTTRAWGLTPLEDQQLAGLLMWVPAGFVYLAALGPLALRVLREPRPQGVRVLAMAGVSARGTP
jgi:cytochrome c oxidase assembly factor CtaG